MTITIGPAGANDWPAIRALLDEASLPFEGLEDCWATWVGTDGPDVVATASLERHRHVFLLRSVAVRRDHRNQGVGAQLVNAALRSVDQPVTLLTETAQDWFSRLGFVRSTREAIDPALLESPELQHLCPDSAVVMVSTGAAPPP